MSKPIEILLVEDSPADVRLTQEALKDSGLDYNLSITNDGVEAMAFLRKEGENSQAPTPDVILLDLNMPRKNGHEVLEEIQADSKLSEIPVVVLTVSQDEQDVLRALNLKMNYYITKPVNPAGLGNVLELIQELWV